MIGTSLGGGDENSTHTDRWDFFWETEKEVPHDYVTFVGRGDETKSYASTWSSSVEIELTFHCIDGTFLEIISVRHGPMGLFGGFETSRGQT